MTSRGGFTIRNRIRLARLEFATTRWESAVTIALTVIATPAAQLLAAIQLLPDEAWIAVLLFGALAEGTLILSSMTDPDAGTGFVGSVLERYFGMRSLQDEGVREQVGHAFEYRARMEGILGGRGRPSRSALSETVIQVDSWLTGICRLAQRLDGFRDEAGFQSASKAQLRERLDDLNARAQATADQKVQRQLRQTIAGLGHRLRMIEELENLIERGKLRLEHAVGALGTIHTQVTIFAARGMEAGDTARLTEEISQEIGQVNAVLAALDRVYEPDLGEDGAI